MAAIKKLRTKISGKFNAEVILHELKTMAKENTTDHWTFITPGAMIRGSIMCPFSSSAAGEFAADPDPPLQHTWYLQLRQLNPPFLT